MNFKTKLSGTGVSIFNIQTDRNHDSIGAFTIEWEFYTELREWGVKDIGVYATKVYGEVEVNFWTEDDNHEVKTEDLTSDDEGWELNTQNDIEWGNCICPQDIEVDYKEKTITVIF